MTMKERMLSGKLYIAEDEELGRDFMRGRSLTRRFNATTEHDYDLRCRLIKELFGSTGERIWVEPPFHCDYGCHIHVGDSFFANYDCLIIDVNEVRIGQNVFFGPRVCIYTAGHPVDAGVRNEKFEYAKPVTIGNDVWIGGNAVINPGVTIGSNVVIGSGSVVTKDIPDNVIAAGNPCRVIRPITDADKEYWQAQKREYEVDME